MKVGSTDEKHYRFELLNDYVDGILDSQSYQKISDHLETCEECSQTVHHIRHYYNYTGDDREGFDNYLEQTKTDILQTLNESRSKQEEPAKIRQLWFNRLPAKIAATLLIIAIPTSLLIYNYQSTNSSMEFVDGYLLEKYYKPPLARGDSDGVAELWAQVALQYEAGNYNESIPALEQIIATGSTLSMAHFYLGIVYLYLEPAQPEEAIAHLEEVVSKENPYYQQGLFYLGLAYFKAGEKPKSIEVLEKISNYKQDEVQELLSALKK